MTFLNKVGYGGGEIVIIFFNFRDQLEGYFKFYYEENKYLCINNA